MAVPAEIRAVPRPVNTIVDDSGTNSPKRYAVRQRASSKYIPGGNPQPKNGKVIGHIIDYKYVPLTDSTASDGPDPRRIFWTGRRFRVCRWSCS